LDNSEIGSFCLAVRKGMSRVWSLLADTSSDIVYLITVHLIADSIYIYDELCRKLLNFVHSALNSEFRLTKCVVRHGLCNNKIIRHLY